MAASGALPLVALGLDRQADRLHAQALGSVCPLHRRWQGLPLEQCGRARPSRVCTWPKILALRWLRTWRRSGCHHGRNYQGSDRSRRLISRRVYRGAQRMLTLMPTFVRVWRESTKAPLFGEVGHPAVLPAQLWLTLA